MWKDSTGTGASRWSTCGADFIAIFWCQERLWEGRKWFDESLKGYEFQQLLSWQASNHCGLKSRDNSEAVLVSHLPLQTQRLQS